MLFIFVEYDIVFPLGTSGSVVHMFRKALNLTQLSLSVWVQVRSAQQGMVIALVNSSQDTVWSLTNFEHVSMSNR